MRHLILLILLFTSMVVLAADNFSNYSPAGQCVIRNVYDATANDSDKASTVPAGSTWEVLWAHVILTSTATVGNRQVVVQFLDDDSVVRADIHAGAVQAASLTRHYEFMRGIYRETSFVDGAIQVPIPMDVFLHPGWQIRILDSATVDAAADDMTISFQVCQRSD